MNISNVQVLSEAVDDLEVGKAFYERQELGVGTYFWDTLLSDIESLVIFAGVHAKYYGCYRMLSKRFPYAVYYEIRDDAAYVIAVLPLRRDLKWIRTKLKGRR